MAAEYELNSPYNFLLFNDVAPMLTMLSARTLQFSLQAPWISGLCHLALSSPVPYHELLAALTHMPLLQVLEDSRVNAIINGDPTKVTTIRLTLPRLTKINIKINEILGPYMSFLNHLNPDAGRCLEFDSVLDNADYLPNAEVLAAVTQVLSTHAKSANLAEATNIKLILYDQKFSFIASVNTEPVFRFTLEQESMDNVFPDGTFKSLLSALKFSKPLKARNLSLDISLDGCGLSVSHPKMIEFMGSFDFVQELTVSFDTFDFLREFSNEVQEPVLPQLQLLSTSYSFLTRPGAVSDTHAFLMSRLQRGTPIPMFSIEVAYDSSGDFQSLEDIRGLKVEISSYGFPDVVYRCGSGTPETKGLVVLNLCWLVEVLRRINSGVIEPSTRRVGVCENKQLFILIVGGTVTVLLFRLCLVQESLGHLHLHVLIFCRHASSRASTSHLSAASRYVLYKSGSDTIIAAFKIVVNNIEFLGAEPPSSSSGSAISNKLDSSSSKRGHEDDEHREQPAAARVKKAGLTLAN
ncbi:hypothetical protein GALMADRAFT_212610 [Galerina marginata CBS 339.88]|uniref:F-box domain-containing protein n=1 Tax=Galerina marginata (strain CBS 339.88) TaxID=685588 RepID=A0A067SZK6_GALM3|nr:hypothetical protein GALMADRAFT_212610 [Galerina marginata CBS 339.88]